MNRRTHRTGLASGLIAAALLSCGLLRTARAGDEVQSITDFEDDQQMTVWEFTQGGKPEPSDKHVTSGKQSIKTTSNAYMTSWKLPKDMSHFDSLVVDIFVDGTDPVGMSLLVGDKAWVDNKSTYWDRHNGSYNLMPGANTVEIPLHGLFRGEAGSRGNGLKTPIDPTQIVRMDMGWKSTGPVAALYIDNIRLVKEVRPDGLQAYDFGPEGQVLFPGFTAIAWNTVYGENGNKAGLSRPRSASNRARDDTFPTRLFQDFIEMGEGDGEFICDAPNGDYNVWIVYDDCGYWGGETCHHTRRSIDAEGKEVYVDNRGAAGPADYLFRFEALEPMPGDSMWDLYAKRLFAPVKFKTTVADGKLNLKFHADAAWSSKIAAVIVYPEAAKADAEKWVATVEERNKTEFDKRATFLGPKPKALTPPAPVQASGVWLGYPSLEATVNSVDAPGAETGALSRQAARGERVSTTFAVRPVKDLAGAEATLTATDLTGPGGTIPAANVDLRYVHYLTHRGFNNIAYTIGPESLRKVAGAHLKLAKDVTRQFWITVLAPADAKPGTYTGSVTLTAGAYSQKLPLTLDVLDVTLDEPDFDMGFFGLDAPGGLTPERAKNAYRDLLTLLKENGMNTYSGGPGVQFSGFDADGKPKLDFTACDAFFKIAKDVGMNRTAHAYGGPGMVHGLQDGYTVGSTGHNWEKQTGKPFGELLKIVWGAVLEHGKANGWPKVAYYMCDEPRTVEGVNELLESMKAYKANVPQVYIGGGYSVDWNNDELGKGSQEIFHTLPFSNLNVHGQRDLDEAKKQGTDIYIYNQGTSRYSFGEYQWAEFHKGVKGRIQWHLLALHGYQFFDLDGREPDTAMINWGKDEILPTIHLARCREGADDFRYAVTLWNRAQKNPASAESKAAIDFLEGINKQIPVDAKGRPQGVMDDDAFRSKCIELLKAIK
ncbi:MAG TPA: hypothetical protein VL860_02395 [Planctomycetota bacterium]|nr:hypothetical protein [Planctomycetota bacterium]